MNLSPEEYALQDYTLDKKFISIVYLNMSTKKGIAFLIYNNKQNSGQINIENSEIMETYLCKDITYNIIENMGRYYVSWEKEGMYYILQNCSSLEECKTIVENIIY